MDNVIQVQGLCKNFKDFSLNKVNLTVPTGSIVGFIGENGAGKTTTLKLILGAIQPDAGSIQVLGSSTLSLEQKQQIGIVFEDSFFYETMTPEQVDSVMRSLHPKWDSDVFSRFIQTFELQPKKLIKDMSKGMRMKLRLAVALSHRPNLLILDEPTSGLDPVVRGEVLDYLREYIQDENHSVLISSHITSDLEKIADSIAYIHNGTMLFQMDTVDLMERYAILQCGEEQLNLLPNEYKIASHKTHFGCETLIQNVDAVRKILPDAMVSRVTLDDIMQFYTRREQQ